MSNTTTKPPRQSSSLPAKNSDFCYRKLQRDPKWPCHHEEQTSQRTYYRDVIHFIHFRMWVAVKSPNMKWWQKQRHKAHHVSTHHLSIQTPSYWKQLKFPAAIGKNKMWACKHHDGRTDGNSEQKCCALVRRRWGHWVTDQEFRNYVPSVMYSWTPVPGQTDTPPGILNAEVSILVK